MNVKAHVLEDFSVESSLQLSLTRYANHCQYWDLNSGIVMFDLVFQIDSSRLYLYVDS